MLALADTEAEAEADWLAEADCDCESEADWLALAL